MKANNALWVVVVVVLVVTAFSVSASFMPPKDVNQQAKDISISVTQPQGEDGKILVGIHCSSASLLTPSTLGAFTCTVKNNTNSDILSMVAAFTVSTDSDGTRTSSSTLLTTDSIVHPDVKDVLGLKPIAPGAEYTFTRSGATECEGYEIKGVNFVMSYVEFEGRSAYGQGSEGWRVIADVRRGAAEYKQWLLQSTDSVDTRNALLTRQPLRSTSEPDNNHLDQGANTYRKQMLKVLTKDGTAGLEKYLRKDKSNRQPN